MLAATGSLEETILPRLWYWLISRVNKVLMLCNFLAMTSHLFFHVKWNLKSSMELARSCCRPKQHPLLHSIFLSFIRLWVKIWHRNKTTCSILNPVPSSRSKSTGMTCPRKGDCSLSQIWIEQHSYFRWWRAKAWKLCHAWFWINCNQGFQPNWSQIRCDVWKPCRDQRWQ